MSTPNTSSNADRDAKVEAGEDKLQAQAEQKLAEMAGNPDLKRSADADLADAEHRTDTTGH